MNIININNLHENIFNFINKNNILIKDFDDIQSVYIKMLEEKNYFIIERELLMSMLVDIVCSLNPSSSNKLRVLETLEYEEDEESNLVDDSSDDDN